MRREATGDRLCSSDVGPARVTSKEHRMTLKSLMTTIAVATVMAAVPAVAPSTLTAVAPTAAFACDNPLDLECDLPDSGCPDCPEPPPPGCGQKGGPQLHYCELPWSSGREEELPTTVPPSRERADHRDPTRR
jgi:hypothetical protein